MTKYHQCSFLTKVSFWECEEHGIGSHWDFFRTFWLLAIFVPLTILVVNTAYDQHIGYEQEIEFIENAGCRDLVEFLAVTPTHGTSYKKAEQKFKWLCTEAKELNLK